MPVGEALQCIVCKPPPPHLTASPPRAFHRTFPPTAAPVSRPGLQPSRLLPRISFRSLLILTAAAAGLSVLARAAGDGGALARTALFLCGFLLLLFAIFVVAFLIARAYAAIALGSPTHTLAGSPFAADQLPPQVVRPRDPVQ